MLIQHEQYLTSSSKVFVSMFVYVAPCMFCVCVGIGFFCGPDLRKDSYEKGFEKSTFAYDRAGFSWGDCVFDRIFISSN